MEAIQKWLEIKEQLVEFGAIGVSVWNEEIHMNESIFAEKFDHSEMTVTDHNSEYPFKVSVIVDGVEFFVIVTESELEKYFPTLIKEEVK